MAKDKTEVITLLKIALDIDRLATLQEQVMIEANPITSPEIRKDIEQIAEAVDRLQSTLTSIYYNNIGE